MENLLYSKEDAQKGVGLLYLEGEKVQLLLMQAGEVSLIRQLNSVVTADENDDEKRIQVVLEVQRSLDFYQTQQAKPPPAAMFLSQELMQLAPWLSEEVQKQLAIQASALAIDQVVSVSPVDDALMEQCLLVIAETQRFKIEGLRFPASEEDAS